MLRHALGGAVILFTLQHFIAPALDFMKMTSPSIISKELTDKLLEKNQNSPLRSYTPLYTPIWSYKVG